LYGGTARIITVVTGPTVKIQDHAVIFGTGRFLMTYAYQRVNRQDVDIISDEGVRR
jgi:hypothetical protein